MQIEAQHLQHVEREKNSKQANRVTASPHGQSAERNDFESNKISQVPDVDTDSQFRQDQEAARQESVQLTARTVLHYEHDIEKLASPVICCKCLSRSTAASRSC